MDVTMMDYTEEALAWAQENWQMLSRWEMRPRGFDFEIPVTLHNVTLYVEAWARMRTLYLEELNGN